MRDCHLDNLVKRNFRMMMDVFHYDLESLGIGNLHTKCLYTAVIMFYLLCGERARSASKYCFVSEVRNRMSRLSHDDTQRQFIHKEIAKFKDHVLRCPFTEREAFFVMLTDDDIPHKDNRNATVLFPGHVFVIEKKINTSNRVYYTVYQSYINHYHLESYAHEKIRNSTIALNETSITEDKARMKKHMHFSYSRMKWFLDNITRLVTSEIWTQDLCTFWKTFTLADGSSFLNHRIFPYIHFCYNLLPTLNCEKEIIAMLSKKREEGRIPHVHKERVDHILAKNRV